MEASGKALDLIKASENCKLKAYPDPASGGDPWTIGWGSTGPDITKRTVWTQAQADARLVSHVHTDAINITYFLDGCNTTQNQFDALIDFVYNLGLGNLKSSTLFKYHKAGKYQDAANEFLKWNKAGGKVLTGLTTRRNKERSLYLA